jgi:hypothetical protein
MMFDYSNEPKYEKGREKKKANGNVKQYRK